MSRLIFFATLQINSIVKNTDLKKCMQSLSVSLASLVAFLVENTGNESIEYLTNGS